MAMANETVTQRKRTVLIVEDNETNREILTELLEDEYDVLQAENGQDGLEQLVAHAGDVSLVMLDAYMPVRSGFEFLEQKRKDPRFDAIPVIVMTASNAVDDEIRCLELGASDFITKPYNVEVMKNRMKSLIRHAAATNDYSILRFATLLADGMRLKTVVEGVETAEQVEALKVLGCDYIQGYYFSKPLPVNEYEEYLKAHT